ncbi:hypothetical protein ACFE04_008652 [Oxalis oulophora]
MVSYTTRPGLLCHVVKAASYTTPPGLLRTVRPPGSSSVKIKYTKVVLFESTLKKDVWYQFFGDFRQSWNVNTSIVSDVLSPFTTRKFIGSISLPGETMKSIGTLRSIVSVNLKQQRRSSQHSNFQKINFYQACDQIGNPV